MMEAYGLQFMLHLAQLELGRQHAKALGLTVTPEEIAQERQRTLAVLEFDRGNGKYDAVRARGTGDIRVRVPMGASTSTPSTFLIGRSAPRLCGGLLEQRDDQTVLVAGDGGRAG